MRLPLLPGLLEDHHGQALRARRRRVLIADHQDKNLRALEVMDAAIDRAILAASLYGRAAHDYFDAQIAASEGDAREASVFLRLALATHTGTATLPQLALTYWPDHRRAVLEALWFFPVPRGSFDADRRHVVALFEAAASTRPELLPLALELAGRTDARQLAPRMTSLLADPRWAPIVRLALTRMGYATEPSRVDARAAEEPMPEADRGLHAEIIAADPRQAHEQLLAQLLAEEPAPTGLNVAWAIMAARAPRRIHDHAMTREDVSAPLRLRVLALTGYADGLVLACAAMAQRPGPVSAAERDVLELALGATPVEARVEPGDLPGKSRALRALLLRALRSAHVPIHNDADRGPWSTESILASPGPTTVRLREGAALVPGVPPLGAPVLEVTHQLRQWLYIERAVLAGHAFSLSASDVFRRQRTALMVAQAVDVLRN